jgi:hypothetical protein
MCCPVSPGRPSDIISARGPVPESHERSQTCRRAEIVAARVHIGSLYAFFFKERVTVFLG